MSPWYKDVIVLSQKSSETTAAAAAPAGPAPTPRQVLSVIESHLSEPTAEGLAQAVSRAISSGDLAPQTHLPPVRSVAYELALSPTTVSKAWRRLRHVGLVITDGRRGTRVVSSGAVAPERYGRVVDPASTAVLDLSTGVPDVDLLPALTPALSRLPAAAVQRSYRDDAVLPALRSHLLAEWPYRVPDLAIVDGAMDAVAAVAAAVLRFADTVVVEDPTFPPLLDLLDHLGARVVGVPMDDEGMDPDALATAVQNSPGVRVIFLQPRGQNPTGVSLSSTRARQLASVIRRTDALVVEDDSTAGVSSTAPVSLGRWIPEQTVHVRGFSKSHGPDLRLAAVSAPNALQSQLAVRRQLAQGWTSRLLQQVLLDLLTDPAAVASVGRARLAYQDRRTRVQTALADHGITCPGADGLNLWVPVVDEAAARVVLATNGIAVAPGGPFRVTTGSAAIRVTTGLVTARHTELAAELARAARASAWSARQ